MVAGVGEDSHATRLLLIVIGSPRMNNKLLVLSLFSCGLLVLNPLGIFIQSAGAKEPHPSVTPYPGSTMSRREDNGFGSYQLVVDFDANGKTDDELFKTLSADGVIVQMSFENPKGRSHSEIFQNYREALEQANYKILFSCSDTECGPNYIRSSWQRVTGMKYFAPQKHYLAASVESEGQKIYLAMVVAPRRHQIFVVEGGEMERGLVSARSIVEGLLSDGRVVLEGLYFDTDKAIVLPDSKEALLSIASYLRENPKKSFYIVGHTDGVGSFEHNLSLSRNRANAVVAALVETYDIDRERLQAEGVGPLSPAKSNSGETGRAANRRVEMVAR